MQEICALIPAFEKEIDYRPGKTMFTKDYVRVNFKSGSFFDNIAAKESSRGKRRHAGLVEECVGVDGNVLQSVIIPTMNISRYLADGTRHPEESLNKAQLFINFLGQKLIIIL